MEHILFSRKAYGKMLDWKSRMADRYALLIEGARRIGKTFLIREFVSKEYESNAANLSIKRIPPAYTGLGTS